ncbi:unnamed protein product [Calypogeia fissa]
MNAFRMSEVILSMRIHLSISLNFNNFSLGCWEWFVHMCSPCLEMLQPRCKQPLKTVLVETAKYRSQRVLYVRFEAAASELKLLMEATESRAKSKKYGQVLTDFHTLYCEQRLSLVLFEGQIFQKICVIVLRRRAFDMFVSLVKRGCKIRYFQP